MKKRYVVVLCAVCFVAGWIANRRQCNIEAFYIGYDSGYYDGVSTAEVAETIVVK